jgi:glutaredoxin-related protein
MTSPQLHIKKIANCTKGVQYLLVGFIKGYAKSYKWGFSGQVVALLQIRTFRNIGIVEVGGKQHLFFQNFIHNIISKNCLFYATANGL